MSVTGADFFRNTVQSPQLFPTRNFSVEFWFSAATAGVLASEVDTIDTNLWDKGIAEILADGTVRAGLPGVPNIDLGKVDFNTWHHLAVAYDDSNQTLKGYLDGALSGSSIGVRQIAGDSGRNYVICFGRGGPKNLGPGSYLVGQFDEVRIWNIAIDDAWVSAHWNNSIDGPISGLGEVLHLDTATGNTSPDSSAAFYDDPALHVP